MIWIIIIIIVIAFFIIVPNLSVNDIQEINKKKFEEQGYHYVGLSGLKYNGGIKNISINNIVTVNMLEEGINFCSDCINKTILFKNIKDISLQNQQYIQNQVSLGKLFCFGVLAFGMNKTSSISNNEYIVLDINDEDGQYNVILQSYDVKNNQNKVKELLKLKDNYY